MDIVFTRKEASHFSSALEFLVRLSLGQWHEIDWAFRMSLTGGEGFEERLAVSEKLHETISSWHVGALKLPHNGYIGIFSPLVSDEVREIMTLYKILRIGVVSGAQLTKPHDHWEKVGVESELIAFKTNSKRNVVLRVGGPVGVLPEDAVWLTLNDGELSKKSLGNIQASDNVGMVYVAIPNVDIDWFWDILELAHRAWSSVIGKGSLMNDRFSPIKEWVERDTSEISKRAREADMNAFFNEVGSLFDEAEGGGGELSQTQNATQS